MAILAIIVAVLLLLIGQGLPGPSTQAAQPEVAAGYLAVDLPRVPGHGSSSAVSINNFGLIVGFAQSPESQAAVAWEQGAPAMLPSLGGPSDMATAVNTAGQVAGFSGPVDDGWLPVRWSGSELTQLETLPGLGECLVLAINDVGTGAGWCYPAGRWNDLSSYRPAIWNQEHVVPLTLPDGDSWGFANGINESGRVVGATGNAQEDSQRAVVWTDGTPAELSGPVPGLPTWARSINSSGSVVGWAEDGNGAQYATVWTDGVPLSLGALPGDSESLAMSINDSGKVVGRSMALDGTRRAFLWDGVQFFVLPQLPGSTGSAANDINNTGLVVGETDFADGSFRATLWTTTTPDWVAEPPATPVVTTEASAGTIAIEIEMVDLAFIEPEIVVPENTEVVVRLTNNGALPHSFVIPGLGVASGEVMPGDTAWVTFNSGPPSTYEFYCGIPGHREAGMVGILKVVDVSD